MSATEQRIPNIADPLPIHNTAYETAAGAENVLNIALDEGTGPSVLLLHGIASSSTTFSNLIPRLADHHRLVALELLGFGKSKADTSSTFSLDDHVAALVRTIRQLALPCGFTLVGHSLGALIAVRYVATQATEVGRLILISPPIYPPVEMLARPVDRATEAARLSAYRRLRHSKATTIGLAKNLERLASVRDSLDLGDNNWNAFERSLANAIETQSTIDDIHNVQIPIDIVFGSLDPFVLPAGIYLAEQRANVTVHRVEGADHLIRPAVAAVAAILIDAV